ncbi:MAG TPA: molybdopterin-binding protein [Pseudolabrys sp.]|nr:molybdopterin-binding protein [Pseudolabrys sp.]
MAPASDTIQTITRLTPLAEVLATLDSDVKPVTQRTIDVAAAAGRVLASDATAPTRPSSAMALQDGWALAADDTLGAGGYAPLQLMTTPHRVEAGQAMPPGTDSVAALDAVKVTKDSAEVLVTVSPGDGVLAAGGDSDPGIPLRYAGERLRATDMAALNCAGRTRVTVREPRIRVVPLRGSGVIVAAARLVASDMERRGGVVKLDEAGRDFNGVLAAETADAIVAIGGTGSGRNDASVRTLAREGSLAVHGMALTPGETAALGFVGQRPVLLLPGRLDAALAVWLTVGRRMLDRLAAAKVNEHEAGETLPLARKVTSTVGLAEVVPVRRNADQFEPLAAKYLPLSSLARSDGWILVPADSEGFAAGSLVQVRAWP